MEKENISVQTNEPEQDVKALPHARMRTVKEMEQLPCVEMREKRTANEKLFSLGNSVYQSICYLNPIHYRDKETGEWKEIDNTLVESAEAPDVLTNRANDAMKLYLSPPQRSHMVRVEDEEGNRIAWSIEGAERRRPQRLERRAVALTAEADSQDTMEEAPTKAKRKAANSMARRKQALEEKSQGEALYEEILPETDLHCTLTENTFKDDIIYKSQRAAKPVSFLFETEGLTLVIQPDQSIDAQNSDGTSVYTLPAPFLRDSGGNIGGVRVDLTAIGKEKWRLTYTPDSDWLRVASYPVTLDPEIKKTLASTDFRYVDSTKPTTVLSGSGCKISRQGNNKCIAFFKYPGGIALPDSSFVITKATLNFRANCVGVVNQEDNPVVYARQVISAWTPAALTFNNQPQISAMDAAAAMTTTTSPYVRDDLSLDISDMARKWAAGENYGVALDVRRDNTTVTIMTGAPTVTRFHFVITYVSQAGLENYFTMETHEGGRAGTAHVNLLNGNLVVERADVIGTGSRMPASVAHYYNSCYRGKAFADFSGYGWKSSFFQEYEQIQTTENNVTITENRYLDADGTVHSFKYPDGVAIGDMYDQSGLSLKMTGNKIFDKNDTQWVFGSSIVRVPVLTSIENAQGDKLTINSRITSPHLLDGAGRKTLLNIANVSSGGKILRRLNSIEAPGTPAGQGIRFTYNAGLQLTTVTHEDNAASTYTYNSINLLTSMTNADGRKLTIEYYDQAPYRVKKITESNGTAVGNCREYVYGDLVTRVIDRTVENGKEMCYHFNDTGNLTSISDMLGHAVVITYSPDKPTNHADSISKMQRSVVNLLKNHGFERTSDWVFEGTAGYTASSCRLGRRCLLFDGNYYSGTQSASQTVDLVPGKAYTLSFYGKRCGFMAIRPSFQYTSEMGTVQEEQGPILLTTAREEFERASYTLTLPENAANGTVTLKLTGEMAQNHVSRVWIDCLQLEEGLVPGNYSLLHNGDFIHIGADGRPESWTPQEDNTEQDTVYTEGVEGKPEMLSPGALRIYGDTGRKKGYYQEMSVSGSAGDVFVAGGWAKAFSRAHGKLLNLLEGYVSRRKKDDRAYKRLKEWEDAVKRPEDDMNKTLCIRVAFKGRDGEFTSAKPVEWSEEWTGWRFASGSIVAPDRYTAVRFYIDYQENINYAEFGGLYLYKEEYGRSYDYDDENNVVSVETLAGMKSNAEYDIYNNMIGYRKPGRPKHLQYRMEYDPNGNYNPTDTTPLTGGKAHRLYKAIDPTGITKSFSYDGSGNVTSTKTYVLDDSGAGFIQANTQYTTDKNFPLKTTDATGKITTQAINTNTGVLNSVTTPLNQTVFYTYDVRKRPTAVETTAGGMSYKNEYAYTHDKITQAKHNTDSDTACDVVYSFAYDALGNPTTTRVGTQELSTLTYSDTGDKLVKGITYGNGGEIHYDHDEFKRLISTRFGDETTPRYEYLYGADGRVARLIDHHLNREIETDYDLALRVAKTKEYENGELIHGTERRMDEFNRSAVLREDLKGNGAPLETRYEYDGVDRPTMVSFGVEGDEVRYHYDKLGRLAQKKLVSEQAEYSVQPTYAAGGHGAGSTTGLATQLDQEGHVLQYTYDDVGNITQELHNDAKTQYEYDKLNQLIRVNDQTGEKSYTYAYDRGGNLLMKSEYAYAEGTGTTGLGTATATIAYTYGDSNWKDKLTAYDGAAISYDAIGNPTNDGTWAYTWENGRSLTGMQKSGTEGEDVSFAYNAVGLRVRKVSGTRGATNYTLMGGKVTHLTRTPTAGAGNQTVQDLHFWYDAQGNAAMVSYSGNDYWYVYNLQGDVIAILDKGNTEVVGYRYDAWGKQIECTGSMAGTLGKENPFRYRGYVYDEETGLYSLSARYYNPEWGRWINADGVIGRIGSLFDHNLFVYCKNNPVVFSDPSGMSLISALKAMVTAVANVVKEVAENINRIITNVASLNSVAPGGLRLLGEDLEYINGGYENGGICCAYTMYEGRGQQGHKGATHIYENDLSSKGMFSSIDELEPGMLIFQHSGKKKANGDLIMDHVGMVVMWDFGDGPQKAVFHSVSVELSAGGDKLALFYNDTGPNVTTIGDDWNYYGVLK